MSNRTNRGFFSGLGGPPALSPHPPEPTPELVAAEQSTLEQRRRLACLELATRVVASRGPDECIATARRFAQYVADGPDEPPPA